VNVLEGQIESGEGRFELKDNTMLLSSLFTLGGSVFAGTPFGAMGPNPNNAPSSNSSSGPGQHLKTSFEDHGDTVEVSIHAILHKLNATAKNPVTITKQQLDAALGSIGFQNSTDVVFNALIATLGTSRINTNTELAMFLAQMIQGSAGLTQTMEPYCLTHLSNCQSLYASPDGVSGQVYYGRGFIQMTGAANYSAASQSIFENPNVLLGAPDVVATNMTLAWQVSFWFWDKYVHTDPDVISGCFGKTTMDIDPSECKGTTQNPTTQSREKYYAAVLSAMGITNPPNFGGCYSTCSASIGASSWPNGTNSAVTSVSLITSPTYGASSSTTVS
jgi:hypothetical protein